VGVRSGAAGCVSWRAIGDTFGDSARIDLAGRPAVPLLHGLALTDHIPAHQARREALRSGLRITVGEVLEYLASGMSEDEILRDFPDLTREDIRACLAFAADRERKFVSVPPA
jgi:uncharacterized protein DUF433